MKKLVLSMFALFGFTAVAIAQTVSVADVDALPGEKVTAILNLEVPADTYTGFQIVLQFPTTGFSVSKDVATGWSGQINNNAIDANGQVKIVAAGNNTFTNAAISLEFTVDGSLALDEYDVTVSGLFEGPGTGVGDDILTPFNDVTFNVNVVSVHSVVLDETSTVAPADATDVNVKVNRTINANTWSTICLPFEMSETQVKAAFGNDVMLADFTGYVATKDGDDVTDLTVNFVKVSAIEANHPYIIKVTNPVKSFTVDGVTIDPEDTPQVSRGYTTGTGKNKVYHPKDFIGTYVADFDFYNAANSYPLFLSDNKFYYATENNTKPMKAFRAYFDFDDYLPEAEESSYGARIMISFDEGSTKIDARTMETIETGKVYNMSGQYVGEAENSDRLPKGIYIVNGKKVIK